MLVLRIVVFKGSNCFNEMLSHVLTFKGEKANNKVVEFNLYMIAYNEFGFHSYVVLNNLPQWQIVLNLIKNEAGIVSLKRLHGYADERKQDTSNCSF